MSDRQPTDHLLLKHLCETHSPTTKRPRCCERGHPGVEKLPDGTIFPVTRGKWDSSAPNYIMAVWFKLNERLKSFR